MRKRAAILLTAAIAAASLTVGTSAVAGASVSSKGAAVCSGKTKKAATKQIKAAYAYFLDGSLGYTADQKGAYIQYLSGKKKSAELVAQFQASSDANAAAAATTGVQVNSVTCKGKNGAVVAFDLVIDGSPLSGLAPPGGAVLEGKTWKVSGLTLCNTQALGDPTVLEQEPCATIVLEETL
ncbi:MAG: hypothetical protein MUP97_01985 [Acidimicrobiia bacterium]|jgi:hypothetical protein|nr:hypothetical protein [Acidimicrobiia bacterium]